MSSLSYSATCMSSVIKCEDGSWIIKASHVFNTSQLNSVTIKDVEFLCKLYHMFDNYYKIIEIDQVCSKPIVLRQKINYNTSDIETLLTLVKDVSKCNYMVSEKQRYQFFVPITPWTYQEEDKFKKVTHHQLASLFHLHGLYTENLIKLVWNNVYNMWDVRISADFQIRNIEARNQKAKSILEAIIKLFPDIKADFWMTPDAEGNSTIRFFIKV